MSAQTPIRRVAVYCGSSPGALPAYRAAAVALGQALAERGLDLVYGGGRVGLMGAIADAALAAGGRVYGVIPQKLQALELGHAGCTELFVVDSMHSRKMMMAQLSQAFIALPGGLGTMEELFEVTTWTQLGYHHKPVGLLNIGGYYDHLCAWLDHAVDQRFVRPEHRGILRTSGDPVDLIEQLERARLPHATKWMDRT